MKNVPKRLIICVDDTSHIALSNSVETYVHRVYSSVRRGMCTGSVKQIARYYSCAGSADDLTSRDRIQASVRGQGYVKQIQEIYESCSQLSPEQDEVWMFGFSRGGFVVRAVAGLLHHLDAMASAGQPEFARSFKQGLKDLEASQGTNITSVTVRPAPRVQFIGMFYTVKPANDDIFDISFNRSTRYMRQALALHEGKKSLTPEVLYPQELYGTALNEHGRSFVEAWFIGQHNDMGGDGEALWISIVPLPVDAT